MLGFLLSELSNLIFLILHTSGSEQFPIPLSSQEEKECLEKMKQNDMAAKQKLIEHNLRLVAHVIKKYYANYNEQEDLISIGTIGLIKGINTFDPDKGTKLATYAARCIENEILMWFRNQKKISQEISISDPIDTDSQGNPLTLMDIICVDDSTLENLDLAYRKAKLLVLIENLEKPRDKEILIRRYGLKGGKPQTQKTVAAALGISRSYVSRIEKRLLNELKEKLSDN
ncbi:MAG: RNA polymerase sigma-28 factor precursor [Firmicutes bacterium ADurb.Bin300]|nr:MAG: RNA polymerase sigma-28 factor precursor [Firmicutes bacterium ADurb.Bin300]